MVTQDLGAVGQPPCRWAGVCQTLRDFSSRGSPRRRGTARPASPQGCPCLAETLAELLLSASSASAVRGLRQGGSHHKDNTAVACKGHKGIS